ncbi:MAG: phosphatidate cytidylyltransferase [Planctomycetes bacterium]|nr:phosphatidate cytidylyltransferase [Planctomycetota bacterium]
MSGRSELGTRFVIGPLLLLSIYGVYYLDGHYTHGRVSAALLGLLAVLGVFEYVAMFRHAGFPVARAHLLGATVLLCGSAFVFGWAQLDRELYPLVVVTMGLLFPLALRGLAPERMASGLEEMGGTLLGFLLIAWPMYLAQGVALRDPESVFFVVMVSKFGDIGAYLSGVCFGRHKLIPHVSPGKTIEGAAGSVVVSCAMSVWLSRTLLPPDVRLTLTGAVLVGIMINATTQIGDLVESLLKRRCGVKDSSRMLPAHGGVLDLIDSLLFSFPAYFLVLVSLT